MVWQYLKNLGLLLKPKGSAHWAGVSSWQARALPQLMNELELFGSGAAGSVGVGAGLSDEEAPPKTPPAPVAFFSDSMQVQLL